MSQNGLCCCVVIVVVVVVVVLAVAASAEQHHVLSVRLEAAVTHNRSSHAALLTLSFMELHTSFEDA